MRMWDFPTQEDPEKPVSTLQNDMQRAATSAAWRIALKLTLNCLRNSDLAGIPSGRSPVFHSEMRKVCLLQVDDMYAQWEYPRPSTGDNRVGHGRFRDW